MMRGYESGEKKMATLKIVQFGDETLRKVCRPVDEITPRIKQLLDDMIDTMRAADGCGLAAPQVGVLRRISVIEVEEGKVYSSSTPRSLPSRVSSRTERDASPTPATQVLQKDRERLPSER